MMNSGVQRHECYCGRAATTLVTDVRGRFYRCGDHINDVVEAEFDRWYETIIERRDILRSMGVFGSDIELDKIGFGLRPSEVGVGDQASAISTAGVLVDKSRRKAWSSKPKGVVKASQGQQSTYVRKALATKWKQVLSPSGELMFYSSGYNSRYGKH